MIMYGADLPALCSHGDLAEPVTERNEVPAFGIPFI